MTAMRIAVTTDYYWPHVGGGVEVVTREVAERLARRGHEVLVLTLNTRGGPNEETLNGVRVVRLPALELTRFLSVQSAVPFNPVGLAMWLRRFRPDILHVNGRFFATSILAMLFRGAIPSVLTVHVGPVRLGRAIGLYEKTVAPWLLRSATRVTAISSLAAEVAPRAEVIPNGVDTVLFRPGSGEQRDFRVVFVGRLIYNKGPQRLLEAVPLLKPDIQVVFVGDGPLRPKLEARARELGVEGRVTFHGVRSDVAQVLRGAGVFVRPSDTGAGDLAVVEAMACGLPVVASRASAGDYIRHGVNGYVLEGMAPREIAVLVNELYAGPDKRRLMGQQARLTAERYSWEATVDRYERLFHETTGIRAEMDDAVARMGPG